MKSSAAGRLAPRLHGPRTDASRTAEAVARAYQTPLEALEACADAAVLRASGLIEDIAYCARESELDVVPRVLAASGDVAVVVQPEATEHRRAIDAASTVNA